MATQSTTIAKKVSSKQVTSESTPFDTQKEIEHIREKVAQVNYLMVGVVIFLAVTFVIQIYVTSMDRIKDKELYLKYDNLYEKYNDKIVETGNKYYLLEKDSNSLKNSFEVFKAKNPTLQYQN
jgi:beta-lactamase regulating signal transducer with metallopeptidase domain